MSQAHLVNENNVFVRFVENEEYPAVMSNPLYRNPNTLPEFDGYVPESNTAEYWQTLAAQVTEVTGKLNLVDENQWRSPRFKIFEAPCVGDAISYAFNGDYRPDGTIVSISKSMRVVVSSSGRKYYRKGSTAQWIHAKTWSMVAGHHDERNPHF